MATTALYVLDYSRVILNEIHLRIQELNVTKDKRDRILHRVGLLTDLMEDLDSRSLEGVPNVVYVALEDMKEHLEASQRIALKLTTQNPLVQLSKAHSNVFTLTNLEKELEYATSNLNVVLTAGNLVLYQELKKSVESGLQAVKREAISPTAGFYLVGEESQVPMKIEKVIVEEKNDHLVISWKDKNKPELVKFYEVRYDDTNNFILPPVSPETHTLILGSPKLIPHYAYTIQIRVINNSGPGPWSDPIIARLKSQVPDKPEKPVIQVTSPTTVKIFVTRPHQTETSKENVVTECVVEFCDQSNSTEWSTVTVTLDVMPTSPEAKIMIEMDNLSKDVVYQFRARLCNYWGESAPSEVVLVQTNCPIPEKPVNLRVSSKRTSEIIKLRWDPPQNNHYIDHYELQFKTGLEGWETATISSRPLGEVMNLKQNTKYQFRVRAVNIKGDTGPYSELVEAETKFATYLRVLISPAVFAGGIIVSPIRRGIAAGILAHRKIRDDPRVVGVLVGIACGIGGGIFGALEGPIAGARLAHKFVWNTTDSISDQSSDDDDDNQVEESDKENNVHEYSKLL